MDGLNKGKYHNKTALIVLGGPSASEWQYLAKKINADVLLGANGVNSLIPNLDYWMCIENMKRTASLARKNDVRAIEFMQMFQRTGPKVRLVKSVALLRNTENVVAVTKSPSFDANDVPPLFSFREYGTGYIKGALMKNKSAIGELKLAVGTVGLQLIHQAGILGCKQVHTIGFDLCFKGNMHHAYKYPPYHPNVYFKPENFTKYHGFSTMHFWIESAEYLVKIKPEMDRVGLEWIDHSNGLIQEVSKCL